jgi:hypothetical protein
MIEWFMKSAPTVFATIGLGDIGSSSIRMWTYCLRSHVYRIADIPTQVAWVSIWTTRTLFHRFQLSSRPDATHICAYVPTNVIIICGWGRQRTDSPPVNNDLQEMDNEWVTNEEQVDLIWMFFLKRTDRRAARYIKKKERPNRLCTTTWKNNKHKHKERKRKKDLHWEVPIKTANDSGSQY